MAVFAIFSGCATVNRPSADDPFEPLNRSVFEFNQKVDDAVLRPVAQAYRNAVPQPVRAGAGNFFANLRDVWSFANNVLQLRLQASAEDFIRVNVNTFFGLGGLLDIATEAGIYRHNEDFGQTLGHWGVGSGPYLVLPLLGPSTVRDALVIPVEQRGDLLLRFDEVRARNLLAATRVIDDRARLLRVTELIGDAALDRYSFTRDAFLQKRRNDVYNGNPPPESESEQDR